MVVGGTVHAAPLLLPLLPCLKSRWFPDGQIVFLAPTKPLVTQQVTACHEAAGIPASATAQLLGNVRPSVRAELWKSKRCALSLWASVRIFLLVARSLALPQLSGCPQVLDLVVARVQRDVP